MTTPKTPFLPTAPVFRSEVPDHVEILRESLRPSVPPPPEPKVFRVAVSICELCLAGVGGECHVPGCAMFLQDAPDSPLAHEVLP